MDVFWEMSLKIASGVLFKPCKQFLYLKEQEL